MTPWKNMCRACLATKESFTYKLYENVSPETYFYCTSVQIYADDLPKALCDTCYKHLTKYTEFKRTCIQSQNTLYNLNSCQTNKTDVAREAKSDFLCHNCPEDTTISVKTESVSDEFDNDVFTVKAEVISDNFRSDLFDIELGETNFQTSKRKTKKRKAKKLVKRKVQRKPKLNVSRKHFNFTCEICNKKFNYQERFEAHKLEHEGKETFIHCMPCNKTFMTWSGLRRHNESEHTLVNLEKLKCSVCGKIYKSQQSLKMHQKIHGERKIYVCDVCGKGYTNKFNLKAHLDSHQDNRERLFTCEHCGKKFYTNTILSSHVSRRHTGRRFVCQICSYPFTDKYNLVKHLLIHDGKKLFKCEICNKSYTTQSSLVEHKRIHSGERPYICSYCPKCFVSKRRLDDHHKIHTGERPHKCTVCEQGFTQRGTLKRHMKVHDRPIPIINGKYNV